MDLTFFGVFGAGLLTFISPCVLPMVPIIAANYLMAGSSSRFAKVKATLLFGAGFLLTFTLMGLSLPWVSQALGESKNALLILSGIVLLIFGLKLSGLLQFQFSWMTRSLQLPDLEKYFPRSLHGFLFGATFGLAWTPCVGPILGGVLTYVATQDRSLVESVALMVTFASGIIAPFVALAWGGDLIQGKLNALKKHLPKIEAYTGQGLIVVSILIFMQAKVPSFGQNAASVGEIAFQHQGQETSLSTLSPDTHKLLFFHSSHCPVCEQMETFMPELEADCRSKDFEIVRVNVDDPRNLAISTHFQVRAVPTLVLLSKEHHELAHTVGYQTETNLRRAIEMVPKLTCKHEFRAPLKTQPSFIPEGKSCDPLAKSGVAC